MALIRGKATKNIIRGKQNKAAGERFEKMIDQALRYYKERDIAVINKTPEPMKLIKSLGEGKFVACFAKKAQVDFCGSLAGGRAIRFEAKQTDTERFTRDRLTDEQMDDLRAHTEMGAYCCVMICFGSDHIYRIPWSIWENMKTAFGRSYVTEKDVKGYRVEIKNGIAMLLDATANEGYVLNEV